MVLTDRKANVFDAKGALHPWPYDLIDSTMKFAYQCQHVPTGHTTRELAYFENWAAFCSCIKLWDEDMPALWRFSKLPCPEREGLPDQCPACGHYVEDEGKFCRECGRHLIHGAGG